MVAGRRQSRHRPAMCWASPRAPWDPEHSERAESEEHPELVERRTGSATQTPVTEKTPSISQAPAVFRPGANSAHWAVVATEYSY